MANVSHLLAINDKARKSISVQREIPIELDIGLLASFDPNPINQPEYNTDREEYLKQSARDSIQVLVNSLFGLPTNLTDEGVVAILPSSAPKTILPRSKPLPKPKPLTKWEQFANQKGIAPKPNKDKLVFDEEKQEWVNRWGWKGKNKDEENAWIRVLKKGEDETEDGLERNPAKMARKDRMLKNQKQQLKNIQRAQAEIAKKSSVLAPSSNLALKSNPSSSSNSTTLTNKKSAIRAAKIAQNTAQTQAEALAKREEQAKRKDQVSNLLLQTKSSTASMGKFDKKFVNEPKVKGIKRKFDPIEQSAKVERKSQVAIAEQVVKNPAAFKEKVIKKQKKAQAQNDPDSVEKVDKTKGLVNTRKAIRTLTGGRGVTALENKSSSRNTKSKKRH